MHRLVLSIPDNPNKTLDKITLEFNRSKLIVLWGNWNSTHRSGALNFRVSTPLKIRKRFVVGSREAVTYLRLFYRVADRQIDYLVL